MKKHIIAGGLFIAWFVVMILVIGVTISCEREKECYDCRIITVWPELNIEYDTTITFCNIPEGVEQFENHNTYVDTTLSDFDTYQIVKCKKK